MNEEEIVLTPMMKQFLDLKAKHPDAVMLFRCGDFYETYSTDAIVASEILGITLTKRANGKGKTIEMAGFPHHALDTYLPKLIRAGKRVAICDQLEDPKLTKKLVKRGITELVTPGVSINDNVLNYKENNFLAAVHFGKASCGVAFLDISTGEFLTAEGPFDYVDKLLNNFGPKEILFERGKRLMFEGNFGSKFFTFELDDWVFTESTAREKLLKHFETKNLKGFGVEHLKNGIIASGAILQYLTMTQHTQIGHITSLARIEEDKYVRLDKFTVRSLELIGSMNDGGSSLLNVIDRTISPMGAQIVLSGYDDKLLAGAIVTGGAANLKNMEEAFSKRTKLEKVRMAKDSQLSLKGGIELKKDGMSNTIIALLAAGKENCYRPEHPREPAQPIQTGLFTEEGESAEEKRRRLAQEAEEKRRKEEAEKQRIADCESFIKKAIELKNAEKYKEALAALSKAELLDVETKNAQIRELEKEIKQLKKGSSLWSKLGKKITTLSDDLLKED